MLKLVKKKTKKPISLRDHYRRRNRVLIKRRTGGFGDILMVRMLFEDFSTAFSNAEITFSCPADYIEMAKYHPFANCIDLNSINEEDFGIVYDISTACRVHEGRYLGANRDHRSDIWAAHCGLKLTSHDMQLKSYDNLKNECSKVLLYHNKENKPSVLLVTQSSKDDFGIAKSLTYNQIQDVVLSLRDQGYYVYTIHNDKQLVYDNLDVDQFVRIHPQSWIALVDAADYVISVDTAVFHMAGGLKKPLVGIFSFTNGKVYGKYYEFILVQKHRDNGDWSCGPCFNMTLCPKTAEVPKPCVTEISSADILAAFSEATDRWPSSKNDQRKKRIDLLDHKT